MISAVDRCRLWSPCIRRAFWLSHGRRLGPECLCLLSCQDLEVEFRCSQNLVSWGASAGGFGAPAAPAGGLDVKQAMGKMDSFGVRYGSIFALKTTDFGFGDLALGSCQDEVRRVIVPVPWSFFANGRCNSESVQHDNFETQLASAWNSALVCFCWLAKWTTTTTTQDPSTDGRNILQT